MLEDFKQLFLRDFSEGVLTDETNIMFNKVLIDYFEDSHQEMDEFIETLIPKEKSVSVADVKLLQQENTDLKKKQNELKRELDSLKIFVERKLNE